MIVIKMQCFLLGGTCRVVVRLPDGEVMVTQVSPDEYANLSMDK